MMESSFSKLEMNNKYIVFLFCLIYLVSCREQHVDDAFLFEEIPSSKTHVNFENKVKDEESFNILKYLYFYNGGGVGIGDINNDGLDDIYFTSNSGEDRLYLNLGGLQFKDITLSAGIKSDSSWSTGVNVVDVNGDGLLDIYVCKLGNYLNYHDHNRLYINRGDLSFKEESEKFGLNFSGFGTQSAFFDFDRDGDLDCYLLNHSRKDESHFVNADKIRYRIDSLAGDRFYENIDGHFYDGTVKSKIFSSSIGFGLGVFISDFNNDRWPDIYVCNDFHENDYLYLNNGNKTFTEVGAKAFDHTSNFSMGVDGADMNNDGGIDIFTLDMKPFEEISYKNGGGWENIEIYNFKRDYGYHHQQPKNCFQIFQNVASKVPYYKEEAAVWALDRTDWSWSVLLEDFDMDGRQDIFISNGIKRRPNDMDFVNFISATNETSSVSDMFLIEKMPEGLCANQLFLNKDKTFVKKTVLGDRKNLSNGCAYSDLDNDGDFDIIINNMNEKASILENKSLAKKTLRIQLKANDRNNQSLGSRVIVYSKGNKWMKEVKAVNGFLSNSSKTLIFPILHSNVDSVEILWPDGSRQMERQLKLNVFNIVSQKSGVVISDTGIHENNKNTIDFTHHENAYNDQRKEVLMPYLLSSYGPSVAVTKDMIYFTNAKGSKGKLLKYSNGILRELPLISSENLSDENNAVFFDANGDGREDLYICQGGNEAKDGDRSLKDKLYLMKDNKYIEDTMMLPEFNFNKSVTKPCDFDKDGDIDIFVGINSSSTGYGNAVPSAIFVNNGNKRFDLQSIDLNEMVFDASWHDLDKNGYDDLIVACHWAPITIFYNDGKKFKKSTIPESEGLWFTLLVDDVDGNGKTDILAGNFGMNHSLRFLSLISNDFDLNGSMDPILTYKDKGLEYTFANKEMLVTQLPNLKKKFLYNKVFSGKTVDKIFDEKSYKKARKRRINTLETTCFFQKEGKWQPEPLPFDLQVSPIRAICKAGGSYFFGGNFWDIDPNIGRQDAGQLSKFIFTGKWIKQNLPFYPELLKSEIRDLAVIHETLIIAINNNQALQLKL